MTRNCPVSIEMSLRRSEFPFEEPTFENVTRHLQDRGASITGTDGEGSTALHIVTNLLETDLVAKVLARGADMYAEDHSGEWPICAALKYKHWGNFDNEQLVTMRCLVPTVIVKYLEKRFDLDRFQREFPQFYVAYMDEIMDAKHLIKMRHSG